MPDKFCMDCGLPAGENFISPNGMNVRHYPVTTGCLHAAIKEIKRLQQQVDYLTDLVENVPVEEAEDDYEIDVRAQRMLMKIVKRAQLDRKRRTQLDRSRFAKSLFYGE